MKYPSVQTWSILASWDKGRCEICQILGDSFLSQETFQAAYGPSNILSGHDREIDLNLRRLCNQIVDLLSTITIPNHHPAFQRSALSLLASWAELFLSFLRILCTSELVFQFLQLRKVQSSNFKVGHFESFFRRAETQEARV